MDKTWAQNALNSERARVSKVRVAYLTRSERVMYQTGVLAVVCRVESVRRAELENCSIRSRTAVRSEERRAKSNEK